MSNWASIETRSDKKAVKFLGFGFVSLHKDSGSCHVTGGLAWSLLGVTT
jgi:hypothetical protein